jgi:CBS domain-containing protein
MSPVKTSAFAPERLHRATAADLMSPNPHSIRDTATVPELVAMFIQRNISGAPVINEAGRPIGVVTEADIIAHDQERFQSHVSTGGPERLDLIGQSPTFGQPASATAMVDATLVQEIMTPIVFSVGPKAPAGEVVEELVRMNVHRLFVVDDDGALIGVVSPLDVLRYMV